MGCELLEYARAVAGEAELDCYEVCDKTGTCPLVGNDRYFPKTAIEEETSEQAGNSGKPLKDILQLIVEKGNVTGK